MATSKNKTSAKTAKDIVKDNGNAVPFGIEYYDNTPKIASEINEEVRNDKAVNHPTHYSLPGGHSVIELVEHLNLCQGHAVQYVMRCEHKGNKRQDLMKAKWYINRELSRMDRYGEDV